MKRAFAVLCLTLFVARPAAAIPDPARIEAFNEELRKEREDFEKKQKVPAQGPRTQEMESYRKRRIEETVRFQNQIETLPLEGQREAVRSYQDTLRVERAAHLEKLKKLSVEPNNRQKERAEFTRKTVKKMQDFYND